MWYIIHHNAVISQSRQKELHHEIVPCQFKGPWGHMSKTKNCHHLPQGKSNPKLNQEKAAACKPQPYQPKIIDVDRVLMVECIAQKEVEEAQYGEEKKKRKRVYT